MIQWKAGQKVEEAGGHPDALLTAVIWVIQWSSSLRSANNKVQGQTSGNILSLTEVSQSLRDTSKCPALLQTFKSAVKSAPYQHGRGLVPISPSMSFLLPAHTWSPRGTQEGRGSFLPDRTEWGHGNWEAERSQPRCVESHPSHVAAVGSIHETWQVSSALWMGSLSLNASLLPSTATPNL